MASVDTMSLLLPVPTVFPYMNSGVGVHYGGCPIGVHVLPPLVATSNVPPSNCLWTALPSMPSPVLDRVYASRTPSPYFPHPHIVGFYPPDNWGYAVIEANGSIIFHTFNEDGSESYVYSFRPSSSPYIYGRRHDAVKFDRVGVVEWQPWYTGYRPPLPPEDAEYFHGLERLWDSGLCDEYERIQRMQPPSCRLLELRRVLSSLEESKPHETPMQTCLLAPHDPDEHRLGICEDWTEIRNDGTLVVEYTTGRTVLETTIVVVQYALICETAVTIVKSRMEILRERAAREKRKRELRRREEARAEAERKRLAEEERRKAEERRRLEEAERKAEREAIRKAEHEARRERNRQIDAENRARAAQKRAEKQQQKLLSEKLKRQREFLERLEHASTSLRLEAVDKFGPWPGKPQRSDSYRDMDRICALVHKHGHSCDFGSDNPGKTLYTFSYTMPLEHPWLSITHVPPESIECAKKTLLTIHEESRFHWYKGLLKASGVDNERFWLRLRSGLDSMDAILAELCSRGDYTSAIRLMIQLVCDEEHDKMMESEMGSIASSMKGRRLSGTREDLTVSRILSKPMALCIIRHRELEEMFARDVAVEFARFGVVTDDPAQRTYLLKRSGSYHLFRIIYIPEEENPTCFEYMRLYSELEEITCEETMYKLNIAARADVLEKDGRPLDGRPIRIFNVKTGETIQIKIGDPNEPGFHEKLIADARKILYHRWTRMKTLSELQMLRSEITSAQVGQILAAKYHNSIIDKRAYAELLSANLKGVVKLREGFGKDHEMYARGEITKRDLEFSTSLLFMEYSAVASAIMKTLDHIEEGKMSPSRHVAEAATGRQTVATGRRQHMRHSRH